MAPKLIFPIFPRVGDQLTWRRTGEEKGRLIFNLNMSELSEYERRRLANIKSNNDILRSLGMNQILCYFVTAEFVGLFTAQAEKKKRRRRDDCSDSDSEEEWIPGVYEETKPTKRTYKKKGMI